MAATAGTPDFSGEEEYVLVQPDARRYDLANTKDADIVAWRADAFGALGFNFVQASELAMRRDVDRAQVARLIGQGATPDQVCEIVL